MRNPSGRQSRAVAFAGAEAKKSRPQAHCEFAGSFRQPRLPLKSLSISRKIAPIPNLPESLVMRLKA